MINRIRITVVLGICMVTMASAQERGIKQAERKFEDYAFIDAIANYEELVAKGYSEQEIYQSLGNANYLNARYDEASEWYGKLMELEGIEIEKEYLYRYAQVLKSTGNYKKSDALMERFNSAKNNDNRASLFADKKDYLDEITQNSGRYSITNLDINSTVSDFSPAFYKEKLVFATARDTGITSRNIHKWNNGAFLNLYAASVGDEGTLSAPQKFSESLNTKTHESSAVFTKDGNTVYFTRNNASKNRFKRDDKGISRLKVLRAAWVGSAWANIEELPFNADQYSVAHPALSEDEKTLYFSSDMPGTLGASDIFSVAIHDDGSFGEPKNLGPTVNTESRETFPFVEGGTLYFASDGHPGLGGLDIFAAKLDGSSEQVLNLGKPVNGQQDDFSYIINASGTGYFASNRAEGVGEDDIYGFQENEPLNFNCTSGLSGTVMEDKTEIPLADALISVVDSAGTIIGNTTTSADGTFQLDRDCSKEEMQLVVNKEGHQKKTRMFSITPGDIEEVMVVLAKEEVEITPPKEGTDLIAHLGLQPILFDLDSAVIRPDAALILQKAAAFLKEQNTLWVEIQSHTDAKASPSYNERLSQARAKATFDYLVSLGVYADALSFKGYGETSMVTDCINWEQCSQDDNERNRRSELIVKLK